MTADRSWGELTINGKVHLRARDYDPGTGTFSRRDFLPGIKGTVTLTNPYHYVNNDPLNMVDPTGLSATEDCNMRSDGQCTYVLGDMWGPLGGGSSNPHQNWSDGISCSCPTAVDFYDTSYYQDEIYFSAIATGVDTRLLHGVFDAETTGVRTSPAIDGNCRGRCSHPGPTNISRQAMIAAQSLQPGLFDAFGGFDSAYNDAYSSYGEPNKQLAATSTALALKFANIILGRAIGTTHTKRIELWRGDKIPDSGHIYKESSLVYAGYYIMGNAGEDQASVDSYLDTFYTSLLKGEHYSGGPNDTDHNPQGDYEKVDPNLHSSGHAGTDLLQSSNEYYCGTAWSHHGESRYVC